MKNQIVKEVKFKYAAANYAYMSAEQFETQNQAIDAAIESMKRTRELGFKVIPYVIVKIEYEKVYNDKVVVSEQTTKTTVELISKDIESSIKYLEDTQYDKLAEEYQMEQQWIKSGYEVE